MKPMSVAAIPCRSPRQWLLGLPALVLAAIALGGAGEATAQQAAQVTTLRMATSAAPRQAIARAWSHFADQVKQKTNGAVVVEVYFSNSLFGERTAIEAALNRGIDIGTSAVSQFAPWTDAMLAFDLPFVFSSSEGARKVLDGPIGSEMRAKVEQQAGL